MEHEPDAVSGEGEVFCGDALDFLLVVSATTDYLGLNLLVVNL